MATDSNTSGTAEALALKVQPREATGTSKARNFRKEGLVPAVAYELGKDSIQFLLDKRDFTQQASRALSSQVFVLGDGVKEIAGRKALVKEIQREGLKGDILHVDLLLLEEKRPALVRVPVVVTGEAPGVKQEGGVLDVQCREVTLLSPPESIPSELEVSVSALSLGERIRTKDIELPEGVSLRSSPEDTVANVIAGRAAKLGDETGEAAADGEGDEAATPPAEGGDAAASGGDAAAS